MYDRTTNFQFYLKIEFLNIMNYPTDIFKIMTIIQNYERLGTVSYVHLVSRCTPTSNCSYSQIEKISDHYFLSRDEAIKYYNSIPNDERVGQVTKIKMVFDNRMYLIKPCDIDKNYPQQFELEDHDYMLAERQAKLKKIGVSDKDLFVFNNMSVEQRDMVFRLIDKIGR
jgi:hypothetical protein